MHRALRGWTLRCIFRGLVCAYPGIGGERFLDAEKFSLYMLNCSGLGHRASTSVVLLCSLLFTTALCEFTLFSCRN